MLQFQSILSVGAADVRWRNLEDELERRDRYMSKKTGKQTWIMLRLEQIKMVDAIHLNIKVSH
jgi:hypothetical protein